MSTGDNENVITYNISICSQPIQEDISDCKDLTDVAMATKCSQMLHVDLGAARLECVL